MLMFGFATTYQTLVDFMHGVLYCISKTTSVSANSDDKNWQNKKDQGLLEFH